MMGDRRLRPDRDGTRRPARAQRLRAAWKDVMPATRPVLHPSIDVLASKIEALPADAAGEEVERLRETCRAKLRTFSLDSHLRNVADPAAVRRKWEVITRFAGNRLR